MSLILPGIGVFGHNTGGAAPTLPDDDFNDGTIDAGWTQWVPATENSDLSFAEGSGAVTITIGNTYSHDPYGTSEPETAVLKQDIAIGTGDFEIITQWTNEPTATIQGHGIYLEDGDGDWHRADVAYNSGLKGFAAVWQGSNMQNKFSPVTVSHWAYLRLQRVSGTTTFYVSSNGTDWSSVGSSWSDTRSWTKAGIYGMRDGAAGSFNATCTDFSYA